MLRFLKRKLSGSVDWFLYSALSEKQKDKLVNAFSEAQKEKIKAWLPEGKKQLQKKQIKAIKDHLYTLGFYSSAVSQLQFIVEEAKTPFMKRLAAWELAQWYANFYDQENAEKALPYLEIARNNTKDTTELRRIAVVEAECLTMLNRRGEAHRIIEDRLAIEKHADLYLACANLETDLEKRFNWINKVYEMYALERIGLSHYETANYDHLIADKADQIQNSAHKVSVLLPAFKAEDGIQVAIESILDQSWTNLELIIVDDCSPDKTKAVAETYAHKDGRVKVLQTPENSGPYIARNIGLQAASGEFITVNDADDWSHPRKLETQVKHLMDHPEVMANTSAHARLTEDLSVYRRGTPGKYIFPNMSSIMFRQEEAVQALGTWDSVRFAADGEFKRRLIQAFGKASYVDLATGPLSLPRQSVSSLTSSSAFGYNGFFMGVRKEYVDSLSFYHRHHETLKYDYPMSTRPFPVPEPMWPQREVLKGQARSFDVLVIGDFRQITTNLAEKKSAITKLKGNYHRIGLVQTYYYDEQASLAIDDSIREEIDGESVQMLVYGETIQARLALVFDTAVFKLPQRYIPEMKVEQACLSGSSDYSHVIASILQTKAEAITQTADQSTAQVLGLDDSL